MFVDIVFDEEQNLFLSFCQHGIVDFRFIFEIDLTFESFSIIVQPRCSGQGKNCFVWLILGTQEVLVANYHVSKDKDSGDWRAKRENADRVAGHYGTQAEAEKAAKQMAANSGGGEVRIHSPKGPIRDSDTVPPANDPNPPKDRKH